MAFIIVKLFSCLHKYIIKIFFIFFIWIKMLWKKQLKNLTYLSYKFALDENRNKERWQCDIEIAINIRKFQDHSISELIPDNRR